MPSPGFKIDDAYSFADRHGLTNDTARIRTLPIHSTVTKAAAVRKAHLVELFERHGLMEEFEAAHWPARYSPSGENRRTYFFRYKALNDSRLAGNEPGLAAGGDEPDDQIRDFVLEARLRDFIADNIEKLSIGGIHLKLFRDEDGRLGVEYPTDVGRIDILAVDGKGDYYVFELKLERGPDRALGQLARYMGWVKLKRAGNKNVHGIVVASSIDTKLRYAASVLSSVRLLEYEVAFRLTDVPRLEAEAVTIP